MALSATIYNLRIDLADIDRGVYEKLDAGREWPAVTPRDIPAGLIAAGAET